MSIGLARRRLYKPERAPARKKGVIGRYAPIGLTNANPTEIRLALFALASEAGVVVGRGAEYDPLRDRYKVVGKSKATGKAQDFTIEGAEVATAIMWARALNGGRLEKRRLA